MLAAGGFDTKMALSEDWDMWRRLSQTCRVSYLDEVLSIVRTHGVNGEDHAILRPWRCTYWDIYFWIKAIRGCPAELRHMIPKVFAAAAKRTFVMCPLYTVRGARAAIAKHVMPWTLRRRLRSWLRPRRRINALFDREIFRDENRRIAP
jgi:hypothetical protein